MQSRAPPGMKTVFKEALKTKSGLVGFGMLIFLLAVVIAVPFIAPYNVVRAWGNVNTWIDNPRHAAPEWVDLFSGQSLSRNIIVHENEFSYGESNTTAGFKISLLRARWDYQYDQFPSEITLRMVNNWSNRNPLISVSWERPDGEKLTLYDRAAQTKAPFSEALPFETTAPILNNVRNWALGVGADDVDLVRPRIALMAVVGPGMMDLHKAEILKGRYTLTVQTIAFNKTDTTQAKFVSYGTVYGIAGTDHLRRDLSIGLMWGAPVALSFGGAAALITVFSQVILGALGAYYGGRFDETIQRATDFFLIIPVLPILILIGAFYTPGILSILFIVVAFSIVGGTTKVARSIALQVKEELHIEAAKSYGAPRRRILFRYIMPRTMPYTFALLALSVPSFIFLEAALSFLGLGDPVLPTWGAVMGEAYTNGAMYNGLWWWIAFPAAGILFATIAFAFLGYSFDKVLNPRLREE